MRHVGHSVSNGIRVLNDKRQTLNTETEEWKERVNKWSTECTAGSQRIHPKRTHHYRSRRVSRERYKQQMMLVRKDLTLDWNLAGPIKYRPIQENDVTLPRLPRNRRRRNRHLQRTRSHLTIPEHV